MKRDVRLGWKREESTEKGILLTQSHNNAQRPSGVSFGGLCFSGANA